MKTTEYRLPRDVIPVDYDIDISASPRRTRFGGVLGLTARVLRPVTSFELNVRGLQVSDVQLQLRSERVRGRVRVHPERETVELVFPEPLPKGRILVGMAFRGKLSSTMHGLYLARDGADRAVVSQCEATDARAIFPCFDEPDLKATLRWTVRTDPGLEVVTNGKLESRRRSGSMETHRFARTRVMSTYVAALAIGELEATRPRRIAGVPCRIVCTAGKLDQTGFAQDVTSRVLPWFVEYFGHRYDYHKLDQVAVPGFDAGAMENVGAVFFRQSLLLMQPGATSWGAEKRIAEVIAHELAHMWFGNLVTMRWWDDLWLNEAFATWIAYEAVDRWRPDWRMWDDALESKQSALAADALVNTHPVYAEVRSPAEATELFDVITYEKGCAVLRMVERYLGEEPFRAGIRDYIATFEHANASGSDLWGKLAAASGEPVEELMRSWILQPGFPLVTVVPSTRDGAPVLHLHQRRFFASPAEMQREHDQRWLVPVVVRYADANGVRTHRMLMSEREATLELPAEGPVRWAYANAGAHGYYRLHLDGRALADLLDGGGLGELEPAERASLVDDQWALVRNGLSDVEEFMQLLAALEHERDFLVTRAVASRLAYLYRFVVREEDRPLLSRFARSLFAPQLDELGWEAVAEEPPPRAVRRATVIQALGFVGRDDGVLAEAARRLAREMRAPAEAEPNLAGVIVQLAALAGDRERLDAMVRVYLARRRKRLAPELQGRYLHALGWFERRAAIERVLELCRDGTVPQDQLRGVLAPLLASRASGPVTWAFLRQHWGELQPRIGDMSIARLVESTGALPLELRDDVARFFADNPVEEARRAVRKALEAMELRRELVERESLRLGDWLRQLEPGSTALARTGSHPAAE